MRDIFKENKKSQAAMEFLMTYGWAILIILLIVGVLFSLDIFNPKAPNNCISVSPIACYDIKLDESGLIEITLGSSDTDTSVLNKITLNSPQSAECTIIEGGNPGNNDIPLDGKSKLNCLFPSGSVELNAGTRFDGNTEISYVLSGGSSEHKLNIKFSGTIEEN